ncbi:hypothetical protein JCGZ_25399 [Jatropha curcas]|uniref:Uncharacterized protein n=1 Tax=Jatropha curcas TaxID=180498 RepID=A0A067JZ37_JATCU|nr:hypothetical protein JCGZ_25399 [Jatropha curcas]
MSADTSPMSSYSPLIEDEESDDVPPTILLPLDSYSPLSEEEDSDEDSPTEKRGKSVLRCLPLTLRTLALVPDEASPVSLIGTGSNLTGTDSEQTSTAAFSQEMCPTYKEFAALLGNDSERALVAAPTRAGFFRSFMRMLGLSVKEARELVVDDHADLARLIEWYLDPLDFEDLEFQRFRTWALVFYLVSTSVLTGPVGVI